MVCGCWCCSEDLVWCKRGLLVLQWGFGVTQGGFGVGRGANRAVPKVSAGLQPAGVTPSGGSILGSFGDHFFGIILGAFWERGAARCAPRGGKQLGQEEPRGSWGTRCPRGRPQG